MSVLVNGSPNSEFYPKRGLCQGDPLALFLFLIVAEGLAGVVRKAVEKNLEVGVQNVKVNMLQYVDDTLFLCEANFKYVCNLKVILHCFELASGLKVNFSKSKIGGVRVDRTLIQQFAAILHYEVMKTPFKYLGLLVGGSHKRVSFWDEVLKRIKIRLGRWKDRFLSLDGRVCLIKSILSSIPLLYLSMYKFPSAELKKIEKIRRRFLWGWGSEGRKISWVLWKKGLRALRSWRSWYFKLKAFQCGSTGKVDLASGD